MNQQKVYKIPCVSSSNNQNNNQNLQKPPKNNFSIKHHSKLILNYFTEFASSTEKFLFLKNIKNKNNYFYYCHQQQSLQAPPLIKNNKLFKFNSSQILSFNFLKILFIFLLIQFLFLKTTTTTLIDSNRCTRNSINLGNIIEQILRDYDTHLLPEAEGVNVTIELHVQGVSKISEITADFELDLMYSEIWMDPRLSFKHLNVCTTNITLKSDFRARVWTPDTCIINSRGSSIHRSPSENTFVILYEHGLVWSNFRSFNY
uniref:Neurotransmitter-gated ion-channel ligand-binding domain-containing protein n=1 Tax=Meloidogyne incognita TaxID=6306 RepID=A0A914LNF4_MELIC